MNRPENLELYKQYKELADATPGTYFVGRLATYKYYNMDQVVAQALMVYGKISGVHRGVAAGAGLPLGTAVAAGTSSPA